MAVVSLFPSFALFPNLDPGKQQYFLLSAQPEHCHRKNRLQLLHHFRWKIPQTPHPHSFFHKKGILKSLSILSQYSPKSPIVSPQFVSDSTSTAGISAFPEIIDWLPSVKVSANTGVPIIVADITILNVHETVFLKHFFFILPPFLSLYMIFCVLTLLFSFSEFDT